MSSSVRDTPVNAGQRTSAPDGTPLESEERPSVLLFMLRMGAFVLLGTPLVAFIWATINQVLELHFDGLRLLLTLPAIVLLVALLAWIGRAAGRWLGETG